MLFRKLLLCGPLVLPAVALLASNPSFPPEDIMRGDANGDHAVNIADPSFILNFLFSGGTRPPCMDAADVDDSGTVSINDAISLNNFLFSGGPPPAAPYPYCGKDTTSDNLGCDKSSCP